jgi:N-acetylglutamate synthase-like GNAT family acetyltransferase
VQAAERWLSEYGSKRITGLIERDHDWATRFWEATGYRPDSRMVRYSKDLDEDSISSLSLAANNRVIRVRVGQSTDVNRLNDFYACNGASARVSPDEKWVLAEQGADVVGVVRLCNENGFLILRTMRVGESYRRRGIGAQMLRVVSALLTEDCYCLPFSYLTAFYGQIGFTVIPIEQAPVHLQDRYHQYTRGGHKIIAMKRSMA